MSAVTDQAQPLQSGGGSDAEVVSTVGFCRGDAVTGYDTLQVSRSVAWAVGQRTAVQPVGQSVQQTVLVFEGRGAQQWFAQTVEQAADCTTQALESSSWVVVDDVGQDLPAGQVLVAYSQVQPGTQSVWDAVVTARRSECVVQVRVQTSQPQASGTVQQAVALSRQALGRAAVAVGSCQ
ncbi:hypothetical protein [Kineococcus aurantiacus]|uniref:hypothetical protein n=1 Tax=Kineococcus aurantiacus TaxID=37633 RepID=UPI0031CFE698